MVMVVYWRYEIEGQRSTDKRWMDFEVFGLHDGESQPAKSVVPFLERKERE